MRERFDIAADLRKIARLLEIKGENPFKTQAYERGARALENHPGDFDALVKTRRLKEIPGIGTALAAIIEEIYRTGECWMLQQLREGLPPGAIELSAVPGLNLKKIIALHDALRIESIADLKAACQEGLVSKVKGFGLKSQAKLLLGYRNSSDSERWISAAQSRTRRGGADSAAPARRSGANRSGSCGSAQTAQRNDTSDLHRRRQQSIESGTRSISALSSPGAYRRA